MTLFAKWLVAVALVLSAVNAALADEAVKSTAVDWKSFERHGDQPLREEGHDRLPQM